MREWFVEVIRLIVLGMMSGERDSLVRRSFQTLMVMTGPQRVVRICATDTGRALC
jgi:hypothetical protein